MRSPYETLIMASIVEKETGPGLGARYDRSGIRQPAQTQMRLQTDPTVIYGLGVGFDGNLRKRRSGDRTPRTTPTLRTGLPPTPIALPGQASLEAAVHPAESSALYFVSRGDGSSHFSDTLEEHNRAVRKYQLEASRSQASAAQRPAPREACAKPMRGRFITLEGIDGAGKSTHLPGSLEGWSGAVGVPDPRARRHSARRGAPQLLSTPGRGRTRRPRRS